MPRPQPSLARLEKMPAREALDALAQQYAVLRAGSWRVKRTFAFEGYALAKRAEDDFAFECDLRVKFFEMIGKNSQKLSLGIMLCIIGPGADGADREASKYGRVIDVLIHLRLNPEQAWAMIQERGIAGLASLAALIIPKHAPAETMEEAEPVDPDAEVEPDDGPDPGDGVSAQPAPSREGTAGTHAAAEEAAPAGMAAEGGYTRAAPSTAEVHDDGDPDFEFIPERDAKLDDASIVRGEFRCTRAVLLLLANEREGVATVHFRMRDVGLTRVELDISNVQIAPTVG